MAGRILREHGLRKLYLGFIPTVIREAVGLGCYFGVYDTIIPHFTHNGNVNLLGSLFAGGFAGIGFWIFIYPVDYVKTIVQGDSLTNPQYSGNWDCAKKEFQRKGISVFYRAFGIMMARAVVANAVGFACF